MGGNPTAPNRAFPSFQVLLVPLQAALFPRALSLLLLWPKHRSLWPHFKAQQKGSQRQLSNIPHLWMRQGRPTGAGARPGD